MTASTTTALTSSDPSTYRNQRAIRSLENWIASKGVTLWSTFDVSDEEGRRRAAEWMWKEIRGFMEHEDEGDEEVRGEDDA